MVVNDDYFDDAAAARERNERLRRGRAKVPFSLHPRLPGKKRPTAQDIIMGG
jgi:hypothetical protein